MRQLNLKRILAIILGIVILAIPFSYVMAEENVTVKSKLESIIGVGNTSDDNGSSLSEDSTENSDDSIEDEEFNVNVPLKISTKSLGGTSNLMTISSTKHTKANISIKQIGSYSEEGKDGYGINRRSICDGDLSYELTGTWEDGSTIYFNNSSDTTYETLTEYCSWLWDLYDGIVPYNAYVFLVTGYSGNVLYLTYDFYTGATEEDWYNAIDGYNDNYVDWTLSCETNSFSVTLPTQMSDCTATLGTTSYTYNGSAKTPSVTVKDGTTTLTKGTHYNVEYSNNINAGTNTGIVTITGIASAGYSGTITKYFTINKANSSVSTAPSGNTYTYNGSSKTLCTAGTASGGTLKYRLYKYTPNVGSASTYSNSYSTSRPSAIQAGTYIIQYYVVGDSNHNDTSVSQVTATISRATISSSTVSISGYTYGGTKSTPSVSSNPGNGSVTYYGRSTSSGTTTNWSSVTSTTYNAGTRYCYAVIGATNNYSSYTTSNTSFTISKASFTASVSIAGYTYEGTKSVPSVSYNPGNGTVTYYGRSTSSGTATNWDNVTSTTYSAGTRYCYAVIAETTNYNSYTTGNTSFTISKANSSVSIAPSANSITYSGSGQTLVTSGTASNGTMLYRLYSYKSNTASSATTYSNSYSSVRPTGTDAGTYVVQYYVSGNTNYNDTTVGEVTVTIDRASLTGVSVNIDNYTYSGTKSTPSLSSNPSGGSVTYYGRSSSGGTSTDWGSVTSTTYNAGTRYCYANIGQTNNYNSYTTCEASFIIYKANTGFSTTPSAISLSYTGSEQTLVTSGSTSHGTVYYKFSACGTKYRL